MDRSDHAAFHCSDYDEEKCPPDCRKAKLVKDYREHREDYDTMTIYWDSFLNLYEYWNGKYYCPRHGEDENQ